MKEDDLTNSLIQNEENRAENEENREIIDLKIETEAHYNNYGSRGYLDLYIQKTTDRRKTEGHMYNIKGNPDSANAVIRQCRKEISNFFKHRRYPNHCHFELCFLPSRENFEHILENKPMYRSLREDNTIVTFRHPDDISPIHIFTSEFEIGDEKWNEYATRTGKLEFDPGDITEGGTK